MIKEKAHGYMKLVLAILLAYPLLVLFTAMHESSHVLGYLLTGGTVTGISVNPITLVGWTSHDGGNGFIGLLFGPLLPLIVCALLIKSRHWLAWYSSFVFAIMGLSSLLYWPGDGGRLANNGLPGMVVYILLLIAYGAIIYLATDKLAAENHDHKFTEKEGWTKGHERKVG